MIYMNKKYSKSFILSLIDATLLEEHASEDSLLFLEKIASKVATICVYPNHLSRFKLKLPCSKATVVNFPHGEDTIETVLSTIQYAFENQAEEIDYVFPYKLYLKGEEQAAFLHYQKALLFCKQYGLHFKVIMEIGSLPLECIYTLSLALIQQGCHFLKTSTGKAKQGATPQAVSRMLQAIKDMHMPCGIKVSGGIKTIKDATQYMRLAEKILDRPLNPTWFRIGASQLVRTLLPEDDY